MWGCLSILHLRCSNIRAMSAFGIGKTKAHYRIGLREGAVQNRQLADHGLHRSGLFRGCQSGGVGAARPVLNSESCTNATARSELRRLLVVDLFYHCEYDRLGPLWHLRQPAQFLHLAIAHAEDQERFWFIVQVGVARPMRSTLRSRVRIIGTSWSMRAHCMSMNRRRSSPSRGHASVRTH